MKNQERNESSKKYLGKSNPKYQFSSANQKYSSKVEFVVPWVQVNKSELENHKNLLESERV